MTDVHSKTCGSCGARVRRTDAKYCNACGEPVSSGESSERSPAKEVNKTSRWRTWRQKCSSWMSRLSYQDVKPYLLMLFAAMLLVAVYYVVSPYQNCQRVEMEDDWLYEISRRRGSEDPVTTNLLGRYLEYRDYTDPYNKNHWAKTCMEETSW